MDAVFLEPKFDMRSVSEAQAALFRPERLMDQAGERIPPSELPSWYGFRAEPQKAGVRFPDALSCVHGGLGLDVYVSDGARRRLIDVIGNECVFLPVRIDDAPQPYFAMWLRDVVPALDLDAATFTELSFLPPKSGDRHPLRLNKFAFHEKMIAGRYLFRLPGKALADLSLHDFATDRFMHATRELGLSGFRFYKGVTDPAMPRPRLVR